MKERFTKFIDTIIALDKGDHTLTDKQWMKKQRWLLALKLFWVIVLVATFLLAINVSISYFVYFFYFVSILFILTKILEYFIDRRVAQLPRRNRKKNESGVFYYRVDFASAGVNWNCAPSTSDDTVSTADSGMFFKEFYSF